MITRQEPLLVPSLGGIKGLNAIHGYHMAYTCRKWSLCRITIWNIQGKDFFFHNILILHENKPFGETRGYITIQTPSWWDLYYVFICSSVCQYACNIPLATGNEILFHIFCKKPHCSVMTHKNPMVRKVSSGFFFILFEYVFTVN